MMCLICTTIDKSVSIVKSTVDEVHVDIDWSQMKTQICKEHAFLNLFKRPFNTEV